MDEEHEVADALEGVAIHAREMLRAVAAPPLFSPMRGKEIPVYDMVLPTWPDAPFWTPLRDVMPRASKCYRLASGAMVHVKPDCRC